MASAIFSEDEYEEEEPQQDLLDFLARRQRLKDDIRRKMRNESGSAIGLVTNEASPRDNFGSFFGPARPFISQRVIQGMDNPENVSRSNHANIIKSAASKSGASSPGKPPRKASPRSSDAPVNSNRMPKQAPEPLSRPKSPSGRPSGLKPSPDELLREGVRHPGNSNRMPKPSSRPKSSSGLPDEVLNSKMPPPKQAQPKFPIKKRKLVRRDEDNEGAKAISEIRSMFGYNPDKYRDNDDTRDMEASFHDILREEKRSARLGKKEDEEELRKIEEEEKRERLRKQAKKRKLSHQEK